MPDPAFSKYRMGNMSRYLLNCAKFDKYTIDLCLLEGIDEKVKYFSLRRIGYG